MEFDFFVLIFKYFLLFYQRYIIIAIAHALILRGSRDASIAKIKNKSAVQNAFLSKINNKKVAVDENDEEY